ncbi:phosphoserine phosphatase SerB [Sphingomonas lenta]
MFTATLIAERNLDDALLSDIVHEFDTECTAGRLKTVDWIDQDRAADLTFDPAKDFSDKDCAELAAAMQQRAWAIAKGGFGRELAMDIIVQPTAGREKRALVADMDSTMITVECIDELADYAGIKPEIAAITEAAMRGELDFEAALDARVRLLKGMDASVIDRCLAERVGIMPGARALVRTMRARGARCVLVSGGFTRFAEPVAAEIGFDRAIANVLEIEGRRLTGAVRRPIVGAEAKERALRETVAEAGVGLESALAVGDGANDLPMIRAAGLGVAYRAKPIVAAAAGARIEHSDLSALLYAQGVPRREWVTS